MPVRFGAPITRLRVGTPGDELTTTNRFARLLATQRGVNDGTIAGGLAHALNQGLAGLAFGLDAGDRREAVAALQQGLAPQPVPQGIQGPPAPGGIPQAVQALSGLPSNERAQRLVQQLGIAQAQQTQADQRARQQFKFQQENTKTEFERLADAAGLQGAERTKFIKDAITAKIAQTRGQAPSAVRNFQHLQNLAKQFGANSPQVRQFSEFVRASKLVNQGNQQQLVNPAAGPGQPGQAFPVGLPPQRTISPNTGQVISAPAVSGGGQAAQGGAPAGGVPAGGVTAADIPPSREAQEKSLIAAQDATDSIKLVEDLIAHPGFSDVVGLPSVTGLLSGSDTLKTLARGSDAVGFRALLKQIGGKQFLQAFQSLKGGGHITEIEGQKATESRTRLTEVGQKEEEYIKAANELITIMRRGKARADRAASGQRPQPGPRAQAGPPAGAIDALRNNPALAEQFDAKFGPGSAASVLGQ